MVTLNPAMREIEAIYASLPQVACKLECGKAMCRGPIVASTSEWNRVRTFLGGDPGPLLNDLTCPVLAEDGTCRAYPVRPLICRLGCVTTDIPCIAGCVPDRWLSREEAEEILARVLKIGGPNRGPGWQLRDLMLEQVATAVRALTEGIRPEVT